jgi:hypothetical protein
MDFLFMTTRATAITAITVKAVTSTADVVATLPINPEPTEGLLCPSSVGAAVGVVVIGELVGDVVGDKDSLAKHVQSLLSFVNDAA